MLRAFIQQLPLGKRLATAVSVWREKKRLVAWLTQHRKQGSSIQEGFHFIGRYSGYQWVKLEERLVIEKDVTIWIAEDAGADPALTIGTDSFIGLRTYLGIYQPIQIGRRVLIGANCYVVSANHCFARRDIPIREQGFTGAPITIEDDAWLGAHVTVLPGVTIGRGAIVGAGGVVNCSIPAWEIWGGVPAKFIKQRPE